MREPPGVWNSGILNLCALILPGHRMGMTRTILFSVVTRKSPVFHNINVNKSIGECSRKIEQPDLNVTMEYMLRLLDVIKHCTVLMMLIGECSLKIG